MSRTQWVCPQEIIPISQNEAVRRLMEREKLEVDGATIGNSGWIAGSPGRTIEMTHFVSTIEPRVD